MLIVEVCVQERFNQALLRNFFEVHRTLMEHAGVLLWSRDIASEAGYGLPEKLITWMYITHRAKIDDRYNIVNYYCSWSRICHPEKQPVHHTKIKTFLYSLWFVDESWVITGDFWWQDDELRRL